MNNAQIVDEVVRKRHTLKVLSDEAFSSTADLLEVRKIIAAAGYAPYHKAADRSHRSVGLCSTQPWRCYALAAADCRTLRAQLIESGNTTKIPKMLAVADSLIQVTWLPNPSSSITAAENEPLFEPTLANMEHIAAASAAIQNMLLAATARDIPNYWSSGGALRTKEVFETLGIPANEILLGSIFLFPRDLTDATTSPGALRDKRGEPADWSCWVELS